MKTSELIGPALDWASAKCEQVLDQLKCSKSGCFYKPEIEHQPVSGMYAPSTNWAQGGLIIEREEIDLECDLALSFLD